MIDQSQNVTLSFKQLIREVEANLEIVSAAGAEAFQSRDLARVMELYVQGLQKTDIKTIVEEMKKTWHQLSQEEPFLNNLIETELASAIINDVVHDDKEVTILGSSFDDIHNGIESIIEKYIRLGIIAFETRDYGRVEYTYRRIQALSEFQQKVEHLKKLWQGIPAREETPLPAIPEILSHLS